MNSNEMVRRTILDLIKDLARKEMESGNKIPVQIRDLILKDYGFDDSDNLTKPDATRSTNEDALNDFVMKLEQLIEERYDSSANHEFDDKLSQAKNEFITSTEKLETVKSEYLQSQLNIISCLNELYSSKIQYSEYLKNRSIAEENKASELEDKLELLKLQSLGKLYGEDSNVIDGHIALKNLLSKEKKELEVMYNNLQQEEINYEQLKDNDEYCELLKTYKELIKQEKRLDSMIENV